MVGFSEMDVGEENEARERGLGGTEGDGGDVYKNAPGVTCTPGAAFQITFSLRSAAQSAAASDASTRKNNKPAARADWPAPLHRPPSALRTAVTSHYRLLGGVASPLRTLSPLPARIIIQIIRQPYRIEILAPWITQPFRGPL